MSSRIKLGNMETKCQANLCGLCGVTKMCVKCAVKPQGENWKKLCEDCSNEPCEICGKLKFLVNHEETGKQICWDCERLENMKIVCPRCGKADELGHGLLHEDENGDKCCEKCFETHVAKPCYRCGEVNMNREDDYGDWQCYDCENKHWCTSCGMLDTDYNVHADFYGGKNGECQDCAIKTELKSMKCECECGLEGEFYSKEKNEWLCNGCVYHYCVMGR
jgi:hypothetical protein